MFYKVETLRIRPVICENDEVLAHVAFMGRGSTRSGRWDAAITEQVSYICYIYVYTYVYIYIHI